MTEHQGEGIQSVDTLMDSTLDSVDAAEEAVLRVAQEIGFSEDDLHPIGMAVRECIVNAVVHGNRYNHRKKVHLGVRKSHDRIIVLVGDEGDGFDPRSVPDPLADENLLNQSGRGLLLIQAFMDHLEIRPRQPFGTEVRMVKYLVKEV